MNGYAKRGCAVLLALVLLMCSLFPACAEGSVWSFGFGRSVIEPPLEDEGKLYIAGYNQGLEISGVNDACEARAVWLDAGDKGVLIIGVDCIALDSGVVAQIREGLSSVENCVAVNVYSTHTHAGLDTLGLWGPLAVDGKNDAYMNRLVEAAISAGREAAANVHDGKLFYGSVRTENMFRDSREPIVFDTNLYQLRFEAADDHAGLRMLFYGAHAESLRGSNSLLSRDFPGLLCDTVQQSTGDDTIFLPGAIGGLLMTKEFVSIYDAKTAVENMQVTADKLVEYTMSILPENEREISPELSLSRQTFTVPMDNPVFLLYKFLGILTNKAYPGESATGYQVESELNVLKLGDIALGLIPGEIFPELVLGGQFGQMNPDGVNPKPLREIAAANGISDLLIIGLSNDELGYIVPPSDFLLNEEAPYLLRITDKYGEDHYEETNSVGPMCAIAVADAFEAAMGSLEPVE